METENTQTQQTQPELTEYEQEMVNKAEEAEAKAKAQADPANAPAMVEPEEVKEEVKEEVAKPSEGEESKEEAKEPKGLDIEKEKDTKKQDDGDKPSVLTPEDLDAYNKEYLENGSLSEETYKELESKGYSKEVVDSYVEGQAALRELSVNRVYDSVGGKETYSNMIEFAKENWSDAQIEGYNKAVNSGDQAQVSFAVESLKAQYEAHNGSSLPKRPLKGTTGGTSSGNKGFANKSEMMEAMRDPRYYKDASYNKMVMEKVANSNF